MKEPLNHPVMRIAGTGSSGKASVINWGMKAILPVEKKLPNAHLLEFLHLIL